MYNNSQITTRENRTRLNFHGIENLSSLMGAQHWKTVQDVQLSEHSDINPDDVKQIEKVEEKDVGKPAENRRWAGEDKDNFAEHYHANHRYSDEEPAVVPEERSGSKPRPFTLNLDSFSTDHKRPEVESNVEEVSESDSTPFPTLHYFHPSTPYGAQANTFEDFDQHPFQSPRQKTSRKTSPTPPIGFTPPLHFRGVYLQPKSSTVGRYESQQDNRSGEYYQKINDYFGKLKSARNETSDYVEETGSAAAANVQKFKDLYTDAFIPAADRGSPKVWSPSSSGKLKSKPFTVMLDIYPMDKEEGEDNSLVDGSLQKPRDTIYFPVKHGAHFYQPQGAAASNLAPQFVKHPGIEPYFPGAKYTTPVVLPRTKNGRMVMKLNLFPRKKAPQIKRTWNMISNRQEEGDYDDYGDDSYDDYEEKDEEDHHHHCNGIVGHNPYGKPITAKWKDKHGDIVHAKYVAIKQWDRLADDYPLDPR